MFCTLQPGDVTSLRNYKKLSDVRKVVRGQAKIVSKEPRWREKDGVIYFSVTSDGTTGEEWIRRLIKKGFRVSNYAEDVLCSSDFKPTKGVTTEIAVLRGRLFNDNERFTKNICAEADRRHLTEPNAEIACLIREMFTDGELEAMGFRWIVAMHKPIKDSFGIQRLLSVHQHDDGCWLRTCSDSRGDKWGRDDGFAFVVRKW
ncbi:MAG: hypothetical protein PHD51_02060 [Patescibacteria group bacterium]|nr:hypothetical protein [Patescibacteria group bacterium]MDD5490355.1 hypothetical protein [Patescibacteria group bacterium]